jgi:Asp-tRNA(Asn)/Glu-tRNA(Gln) amidotransferase A subunit family amidase
MGEENATNQPESDELPEEVAQADENQTTADESAEDGQPQDGQANQPDEEEEEVDVDGKKYRVPKALKGALMMQADYTRKTQELAELRRAAEAEKTRFQQANAEQVQALATVTALDQQLQQFDQINWQQLSDTDPVQAQKLWMQYTQLKDARQQVATRVQQMEQQRAFETQQEIVKRLEEGHAVLKREIPNWGPDVAKQINEFAAKEYGFQPQELAQIVDPRIVKVLHNAMVGAQLLKKQQGSAQSNQAAKPVTKVGGTNAPARRDMGSLPINDWMKARSEQLRKSKGR